MKMRLVSQGGSSWWHYPVLLRGWAVTNATPHEYWRQNKTKQEKRPEHLCHSYVQVLKTFAPCPFINCHWIPIIFNDYLSISASCYTCTLLFPLCICLFIPHFCPWACCLLPPHCLIYQRMRNQQQGCCFWRFLCKTTFPLNLGLPQCSITALLAGELEELKTPPL